jgi:hypothetical protein
VAEELAQADRAIREFLSQNLRNRGHVQHFSTLPIAEGAKEAIRVDAIAQAGILLKKEVGPLPFEVGDREGDKGLDAPGFTGQSGGQGWSGGFGVWLRQG